VTRMAAKAHRVLIAQLDEDAHGTRDR
jgi:hypothetical protein